MAYTFDRSSSTTSTAPGGFCLARCQLDSLVGDGIVGADLVLVSIALGCCGLSGEGKPRCLGGVVVILDT